MKKLIISVVQNEDADAVVDALLEEEFRATRLASTGGFLRRGNTTLMIGADESQVDYVLDLIRQTARSGMAPPAASMEYTPPPRWSGSSATGRVPRSFIPWLVELSADGWSRTTTARGTTVTAWGARRCSASHRRPGGVGRRDVATVRRPHAPALPLLLQSCALFQQTDQRRPQQRAVVTTRAGPLPRP